MVLQAQGGSTTERLSAATQKLSQRRPYNCNDRQQRRLSGYFLSGGVASGTVVSNGGVETISSGGTASGAIVQVDGADDVSGGTTIGTTLSGGTETIFDSGVASGTIVSSGGSQFVNSSGFATATVISSGGFEVVSSGGVASGTTIQAGGSETILAGGLDSAALLVGGTQTVFGTASNVVLDANAVQVVSSGGIAISTVISATDPQVVLFSGTASADRQQRRLSDRFVRRSGDRHGRQQRRQRNCLVGWCRQQHGDRVRRHRDNQRRRRR